MPPERLASLLARLSAYAVVAFACAQLLHAREPANSTGAAFIVLLLGIGALGAARAFARRPRRVPFRGWVKGRSPPP